MSNSKLEFSRGEFIAGKYEVLDLLDESPLGLTYRVKHQSSGKFVRLTMLRSKIAGREQKDELLEGFKAAKAVTHPNLIKVGELGEHEGLAYYTMEDFEGSTLRELLQEYKIAGKQFAVKEAAQVVMQILEALKAVQESDPSAAFRALRPEYVLVNVRRTGPRRANFVAQAKLVGYGFWNLVPTGTLAEDEFTRGEAQYMAPELKSFEPTPTVRCDIYSTGVILYEMLTGQAPVGTFQRPKSVRAELPDVVNDIIELSLANAPEDRYQTPADFIFNIQAIFHDVTVSGGDRSGPPVAGYAVAAVGVALVAVLAVLAWRHNTRADPNVIIDQQLRVEVKKENDRLRPETSVIEHILNNHPPNMAFIWTGPYIAGKMHIDSDSMASETLATKTQVDGFLVDVYEFPNKAGVQPIYNVSYMEAKNKCLLAGKRLCTATEWEKACKGPLNGLYAYHTDVPDGGFDPAFCGNGLADRGYIAGSKEECKSGWGAYDMSGNFREWTMQAPIGRDTRRIVKGGGAGAKPERETRCAFTTDEAISYRDNTISFRCCKDVERTPVTQEEGGDKGGGGKEGDAG